MTLPALVEDGHGDGGEADFKFFVDSVAYPLRATSEQLLFPLAAVRHGPWRSRGQAHRFEDLVFLSSVVRAARRTLPLDVACRGVRLPTQS